MRWRDNRAACGDHTPPPLVTGAQEPDAHVLADAGRRIGPVPRLWAIRGRG
ncbi:MAG: hypothetical protein ACK55Z_11160 [bacterium]